MEHTNRAVLVGDQAGSLESGGDNTHSLAVHTEHFRQELMREKKVVAVGTVPVILITGVGGDLGPDASLFAYRLMKPVEPAKLLRVISSVEDAAS